jgi:hypothetical protein
MDSGRPSTVQAPSGASLRCFDRWRAWWKASVDASVRRCPAGRVEGRRGGPAGLGVPPERPQLDRPLPAGWPDGGAAAHRAPARQGRVGAVPSRSSIYRCLKRHGLIDLRRRRKRRGLRSLGAGPSHAAVADQRDGRPHARGRCRAQGRHRPRPRKRNYRPLFPPAPRPGGEENMVARRPSRRLASEP